MLESHKNFIFKVSTPHAIGLGFKLEGFNWIFTNEHLVRSNRDVVVETLDGQIAKAGIIYVDPLLDVAILHLPFDISGGFHISPIVDFEKGMSLKSVGILSDELIMVKGEVMETVHPTERWEYIVHNATLSYENTGGPVLDSAGKVISINNYGMTAEVTQSTSLPMVGIEDIFDKLEGNDKMEWVRCYNCRTFLSEKVALESQSCTVCNEYVEFPKNAEVYETKGVAKTVEIMLDQASYDVSLSRKGMNAWEIRSGSARISLSYHEKSGVINGDAVLCKLPVNNRDRILQYLLIENQSLKNLSFSVQDDTVFLP